MINDRYELAHHIHTGGMGEVWLARDGESGRRIAMKLLRPKFAEDEQAIARFQQEARLTSSLSNENICEILEVGSTDDGLFYIAMPFLLGRSFAELLSKRSYKDGTMSLKRVSNIVEQVLVGLEAAHEQLIVHRDLKPSNIFLMRTRERTDVVKLIDFGVSKVLDDDSEKLTRTGIAVGTTYYMAPEQLGGHEVDHRADIYSVGVIIYEALSGQRPHKGDTPDQVAIEIESAKPFPSPRSINPTIPRSIEKVILKAMAREPESRYSSAAKMLSAFQRAIRDKDLNEESVTSSVTVDDFPMRTPSVAATAAAEMSRSSRLQPMHVVIAIVILLAIITGTVLLLKK